MGFTPLCPQPRLLLREPRRPMLPDSAEYLGRKDVMATSATPQNTDFSRDVLGRYVCNGFDEVFASAGSNPFDIIVLGGGSFGPIFAQHCSIETRAASAAF